MGEVKVIKASAGSGKTFRLAYEYILRVVREPLSYRHILAVTFTNKATEEMKRRILEQLNLLANGRSPAYMEMLARDTGYRPEEISKRALEARTWILHDYSRFSILTIDKFFQRIIRSFVRELGIDLNFNLEIHTDSLLTRTADTLIEGLSQDDVLRKWISGYVEERIEGGQRWDIKSGIVSIARELFREDFRKIAAGVPEMDEIRKVLKTAAERYESLSGRIVSEARQAMEAIEGAGLSCNDFLYGKTGVGGYISKTAQGRIEDYGGRVEKALLSDEAWCSKTSPLRESILHITPYLREKLAVICTTYRENCRFFASYQLLKDNYRRFALLGNLARIMEGICTQESIMPISETNNVLSKLISGNDAPFIFEKAGTRFDTFMIDEFQDTSAMQWENFLPLLQNAVSQSETSPVLLVGDVKQSIYRWRGGDWRILSERVARNFESTGVETLQANWRSRPVVVGFNNFLMERMVEAADAIVREILSAAGSDRLISEEKCEELQSMLTKAYEGARQVPSGKDPGGHVTVTYYGLEDPEAVPPVIRQIEQLQQRRFRAGEIAVLVRRNSEGVAIADMLLAHKAANPGSPYCYDVVTQESLCIGASAVVNFVMACLRLSEQDENISGKVFYNKFLGREFSSAIPAEENDFLASLSALSLLEAFDRTVGYYGLGKPEHTAYLQALHDQMIGWTNTRIGDIPMFVGWWDENGSVQSINTPANADAVTIVSIHKSKGLEYPAVIIPYCNWSLAPHPQSIVWAHSGKGGFETLGRVPVPFIEKMGKSHFSEGYFEEMVMSFVDNINLFYVAATRARDELHIMIPKPPKQSLRINAIISSCIDPDNLPPGMGTVVSDSGEDSIRIDYGQPVKKDTDRLQAKTQPRTMSFRSYPNNGRMKQKRSYLRFEKDGLDSPVNPRDHGILLHSALETAVTAEDVFDNLRALERSGDIAAPEKCELEQTVKKALESGPAKKWFDGSWERVFNETDILIPGSPYQRRPDRVMESPEEVVVVDYKFGAIREKAHQKQVGYYKDLLSRMTGKPTSGYIWYVTLNEVVEV